MDEQSTANDCPPGHRLIQPVRWLIGFQVLVVLLLAILVMRGTGVNRRQFWEYKVEAISDTGFADRLNSLGSQGWEVVSTRPTEDAQGPAGYEVILKRRS